MYEGVFGTNMAYLSRRLDVATSSRHRVLCSTATLGKPSDFIYQLTGRMTVPITQEDDGSPAPGRTVLLAKDPGYDRLVELLKRFAALEGGRFLAFADSRKMVEHVVAATMRVEAASATDDANHDDDEPLDDETEACGQERMGLIEYFPIALATRPRMRRISRVPCGGERWRRRVD